MEKLFSIFIMILGFFYISKADKRTYIKKDRAIFTVYGSGLMLSGFLFLIDKIVTGLFIIIISNIILIFFGNNY